MILSVVTPLYYDATGVIIEENFNTTPIARFGLDKVMMANAFEVSTPEGQIKASELAAKNLKDKFTLEGTYADINIDDNNILTYGGKDVKDIYGLKPKFDIKVVSPTDVTVTGITPDSTNGCIKAKVDANLGILHDIEIEVKLTISYPYAKDKVASFKVIIPKTHKEDK